MQGPGVQSVRVSRVHREGIPGYYLGLKVSVVGCVQPEHERWVRGLIVCMQACGRVRVRACACARVRVRACARARVRACACAFLLSLSLAHFLPPSDPARAFVVVSSSGSVGRGVGWAYGRGRQSRRNIF